MESLDGVGVPLFVVEALPDVVCGRYAMAGVTAGFLEHRDGLIVLLGAYEAAAIVVLEAHIGGVILYAEAVVLQFGFESLLGHLLVFLGKLLVVGMGL